MSQANKIESMSHLISELIQIDSNSAGCRVGRGTSARLGLGAKEKGEEDYLTVLTPLLLLALGLEGRAGVDQQALLGPAGRAVTLGPPPGRHAVARVQLVEHVKGRVLGNEVDALRGGRRVRVS